jgi:hypothetical protein
MASAPSESLDEARARFERTWRELRGNMGTKIQLGTIPEFKQLAAECAPLGLKPCASLTCRTPINLRKEFWVGSSFCRSCSKNPEMKTSVHKRKLEASEMVQDRGVRFLSLTVEDEARDWLLVLLRKKGLEVRATPEFRRADLAVRSLEWNTDKWLPVQLKSDGMYKMDGRAKPNDRSEPKSGHGCASFQKCNKYEGMLVVFVKSRLKEDGGTARYVWVCTGDEIEQYYMNEHVDGTLGMPRIPPICGFNDDDIATGVVDVLSTADPELHRSWESIWLEVEGSAQQREVALMLALRACGFAIDFGFGNQTVVDCTISGTEDWQNIGSTQVKTVDTKTGASPVRHCVNGVTQRPYSYHDMFDTLLEGAIVKARETYYVFYAFQPRHALLLNGVFHHDGYDKRPWSAGKTSISPPLGIFEQWLTGKKQKQPFTKNNEWLLKPSYNWRVPVEITRDNAAAAGLPWEWVEKHSKPAADPSAFPSQAQLDKLQQRIEQSDVLVQAAAERRAAEAAAARAEAAAARAEAARAGPSHVYNITNTTNNTTNNHIHIRPDDLERPAGKRRIVDFFKRIE